MAHGEKRLDRARSGRRGYASPGGTMRATARQVTACRDVADVQTRREARHGFAGRDTADIAAHRVPGLRATGLVTVGVACRDIAGND